MCYTTIDATIRDHKRTRKRQLTQVQGKRDRPRGQEQQYRIFSGGQHGHGQAEDFWIETSAREHERWTRVVLEHIRGHCQQIGEQATDRQRGPRAREPHHGLCHAGGMESLVQEDLDQGSQMWGHGKDHKQI